MQRRFQHLFVPCRQEEALHQIQDAVDSYWNEVLSAELPGWRRNRQAREDLATSSRTLQDRAD
jgi:hypothetical protein